MKKFVSMFFVLVLSISMLVGCGSQVAPAVEEKIVVVEATAEPTPEPTEEPTPEPTEEPTQSSNNEVVDLFFSTAEEAYKDTNVDYITTYEDNHAIITFDLYNMKRFWDTDYETRESLIIVFNEMTGMCNVLTDGEIDFSVLVYDSYSDSVLFVSMNGEDTTEGFVHYLTYGY